MKNKEGPFLLVLLFIIVIIGGGIWWGVSMYQTNFKNDLTAVCQELGYQKATDYNFCSNIGMDYSSYSEKLYQVECDEEKILNGVIVEVNEHSVCQEYDKWGDCVYSKHSSDRFVRYDEQYSKYWCN